MHWVLGSGGLLGSAVVRELERRDLPFARSDVPWSDVDAAVSTLLRDADRLLARADLQICWCAGSGVVGSGEDTLAREVEVLRRFLDGLAGLLEGGRDGRRVELFLASSAGGVYAGAEGAPFTEHSATAALAPYGHAKLAAEGLVADFARRSGARVAIGRIANLYGPGQDITKAQGLVTQLCLAHLRRRPLLLFVPLDTTRDYVYVDDAARVTLGCLERIAGEPAGTLRIKVIAARRPTTIGALVAEIERVARRRALLVLGTTPATRFQVRDLRLRSEVWRGLDDLARTGLAEGVASTLEALRRQLMANGEKSLPG